MGTTTVTWTARDAAGNSATATHAVVVKVSSDAPAITLSSPGNNMSFLVGSTLSITTFVSNVQAGDVLKVEFFQGDTKIGEDLTPPYHQSWASLPLGTYQLTTKATLRTGGNSTNPPSVTSPPRRITVVDAAAVDAAAP